MAEVESSFAQAPDPVVEFVAPETIDEIADLVASDVAGEASGVAAGSDGVEVLEPATSLLPTFASADQVVLPPVNTLATSADELAELALSVRDEELPPSADSTALAADLVAEAVATFQEQHSEDERYEPIGEGDTTGTSMFPPLAKALVEGEKSPSTTCRRSSRSTTAPTRASPVS